MSASERRPPDDALDARIEASLRRLFTPPPHAGRDLVARPSAPPAGGGAGPWAFTLLAAAAAVALWAAGPWRGGDEARTPDEQDVAGAPPTSTELARLLPGDRLADLTCGAVHRPDLESLYAEVASTDTPFVTACSSPGDLEATLRERYDQELALEPDASNLLFGPYPVEQWPTGTVLSGHPEGLPSVLVAEREANLVCCMDVGLPESSELRLYPWRLGEITLYEITPLDRPYLLELFTEYR